MKLFCPPTHSVGMEDGSPPKSPQSGVGTLDPMQTSCDSVSGRPVAPAALATSDRDGELRNSPIPPRKTHFGGWNRPCSGTPNDQVKPTRGLTRTSVGTSSVR